MKALTVLILNLIASKGKASIKVHSKHDEILIQEHRITEHRLFNSRYERLQNHRRSIRPVFYPDNHLPPFQVLDYGGKHPLERSLQVQSFDDDNPRQSLLYAEADPVPLRIKFITEPLIERMGEDDIIDEHIQLLITDVSKLHRKHCVGHTEKNVSHRILHFTFLAT